MKVAKVKVKKRDDWPNSYKMSDSNENKPAIKLHTLTQNKQIYVVCQLFLYGTTVLQHATAKNVGI